jgi:hypothetical protein
MNREERERMVDRLLNEALTTREVEPRAELEQRILANLRAQPEPRPWWSRMRTWAPVAVAAAVLIALAGGLRIGSKPQPARPAVAIEHQPAPPSAAKTVPAPAQQAAAHRRLLPTASLPNTVVAGKVTPPHDVRQDVFPSPVPLTPEEQMLMRLALRNSAEALLVAANQENERERIQTYFETGKAPAVEPEAAPITR